MSELIAWLSRIVNSWKFWIVVAPWEVGIRVRIGKHARALQPGPHFRIPFLDRITVVNTRLRVLTSPPVTIQNGKPWQALCRRATVGYVIHDPLVAIKAYNQPQAAVMALIQAKLAATEPSPDLAKALKELEENGVRVVFSQLVEDVEAPALRLLQRESDVWGGEVGPPTPIGGGTDQF